MATYEEENDTLTWAEQHIYGSLRLGYWQPDSMMFPKPALPATDTFRYKVKVGDKLYEIANHLGNVLATITDRKIPKETGTPNGIADYYVADIATVQDYYPFGMVMPGRNWKAASSNGYGFGFNGQQQDNEISSVGNINTAQFWEYDSRLGKRWNMDIIPKHHESPYAVFFNNPILISDINGDDGEVEVDKEDHTVKVTADVYYDASDPRFEELLYSCGEGWNYNPTTKDWDDADQGLFAEENVFNGTPQTIIDDDGQAWIVTYQINFIPLASQDEVDKKLASDPYANAIKILSEPPANEPWAKGQYIPATRTIEAYGGFNLVFEHELGHLLGLVHSCDGPAATTENPFFGKTWLATGGLDGGFNGYRSSEGPLMSYANSKNIRSYEYKNTVIDAINLAKQTNDCFVAIHIYGAASDKKAPVQIQ
ncbi:MAG: hypothetical protein WAT43_19145 [Chitinophagales bacterium]